MNAFRRTHVGVFVSVDSDHGWTRKDMDMLRSAKAFKGYKLRARDGDIGKANEFYFDDLHWTIRYLVADTGGWLSVRQVLITPYLGFV